jgi:hypothetical protein
MFNNSDIGYMEGFTSPDANATNGSAAAVSIQNNMNSKKSAYSSAPASTPPASTPPAPASSSAAAANLVAKIKDRVGAGAEGFDILGAERNMQLGKKSNSIPANKQVNGDGVMPFDSSFSNLFSAFK